MSRGDGGGRAAGPEAWLQAGLARHRAAIDRLEGEPLLRLADLVGLLHRVLARGGKVLACGNGGSAADAQHLVAELVGRYRDERPALAATALTADGAVLTCVANDYDFERLFSRQIEALGRPGDLLIAISTSGRSPNVVRALETASRLGLETAALLGRDGGEARARAALAIVVPDEETARIQECHGLMIHLACEALDRLLASSGAKP
jgi:D-sedoheptulose 7-phosphate isomerase